MKRLNLFRFIVWPVLASILIILTSVMPAFAAQIPPNVSQSAIDGKIFLDRNIGLVDTININSVDYFIVQYSNLIPFSSGIELYSAAGEKITDSSKVKSALTTLSWKQAAQSISSSDINSLKNILQFSTRINQTLTSLRSATNTVTSGVNSLKNTSVTIPLVGRKSAWDAAVAAYPEISSLAATLTSLDDDLNALNKTATSLSQDIPAVISGFQSAQTSGQTSSDLTFSIERTITGLSTMMSLTNKLSSRLDNVSSILSNAASSLNRASNTPYVGQYISNFAVTVRNLQGSVDSVKSSAQSFLTMLSTQSSKLETVVKSENENEKRLSNSWSSRTNASTKVYLFVGGLVALLIMLIVIFHILRKKGLRTTALVSLAVFIGIMAFSSVASASNFKGSLQTATIQQTTAPNSTPSVPKVLFNTFDSGFDFNEVLGPVTLRGNNLWVARYDSWDIPDRSWDPITHKEGPDLIKWDLATGLHQDYTIFSSHNRINTLFQDNHDNLWVGTIFGEVMRFDGKNWATMTILGTQQKPIMTEIGFIFQDREGNIWAATQGGGIQMGVIGRYDGQNWETFTLSTSPYEVTGIGQDKNGKIWVGSYKGAFFYDNTKWTFLNYNDVIPDKPVSDVHIIGQDDRGYLLALFALSPSYNYNYALCAYDGNSWRMLIPSLYNMRRIMLDSKGNLWAIVNWNLICFDHDGKTLQNFGQVPVTDNDLTAGGGFAGQDDKGNIWIWGTITLNMINVQPQ